jgi:hypothetical protein
MNNMNYVYVELEKNC